MTLFSKSSGFECVFVEKPPEIVQTECLICLLVLREPYQVICCGKSFCHSCIERVKASSNPACPHCNRKPKFTDFPNIGLQQSLYQLQVRCTHQKKGCKWTGELGELDNHLNLDLQPADHSNQFEGCVFVVLECIYCSETHQRLHIKLHQNEVCWKRPFTCEHCKVYMSTFESVTTNHWPVCEFYPVPCQCGAVLQRKAIKSHLAKDCPLSVIECDFQYAGCEVRLPRKDMEEHLSVGLVKHMSMVATSQKKLVKENEVLKQRVIELEREQKRHQNQFEVLHLGVYTPVVEITLYNFKQHKENRESWKQEFYTHNRGYKLCLVCHPLTTWAMLQHYNKHDYISVIFHLMRGKYDDELYWPFRFNITVQLLRQDRSGSVSNKHYTRRITIPCGDEGWGRLKKEAERDIRESGSGNWYFFSHNDCDKRYIKNDSLRLRIAKVDFN